MPYRPLLDLSPPVTAFFLIFALVTAFFLIFAVFTAFFFSCLVPTLFFGRLIDRVAGAA